MTQFRFRFVPIVMGLLVAAVLSGCAAALVGGVMVGGSLMAMDRRTSGAQIEDKAIELKLRNRVRELIGERGHVVITSYNRMVLLTGEVQNEADKLAIEQTGARVENVRSLVNELAVMGSSSLTSRSNDAILTTKTKATFVDAGDIYANAFKVVTERGTVYLMGRVSEREADRAVELARSIGGVQRVVRVLEIITETELAELQPKGSTTKAATSKP